MSAAAADSARTVILAIDSATTRVVVAVGTPSGELIEATDWPAGYRHGETLLPAVAALLEKLDLAPTSPGGHRRRHRSGSVHRPAGRDRDGQGPGPCAGRPDRRGLDRGCAARRSARRTPSCCCRPDPRTGCSSGGACRHGWSGPARTPTCPADASLIALDLAGRAPDDALERGEAARAGLGAALVSLGAARLAAGDVDDLAGLVPEYVTLPRGVRSEGGEVSWSRDPR